jgi:hypothetical protein
VNLKVRASVALLALVPAIAVAAYAGYPKLAALLPRSGRVLDFQIITTSDNGPERAKYVEASLAPAAGSADDFVATAVAIASVLPGDKVIVNLVRDDVLPAVDAWRRTLARAEFHRADASPWYVSSAEPPLPAAQIIASYEYSVRAGLALNDTNDLLSPAGDRALIKDIAEHHDIPVESVTKIAVLHHESGARSDWWTLSGPGSDHVQALAKCYADAAKAPEAWKACR